MGGSTREQSKQEFFQVFLMFYNSQRGVKTFDLWVEKLENDHNRSFFKIFNRLEKLF